MTIIMNQVTCSLCNIETDELKGMKLNLLLGKNDRDNIAVKFFETIIRTYSKENEKHNLKIKKYLVSRRYIVQQNYQRKCKYNM